MSSLPGPLRADYRRHVFYPWLGTMALYGAFVLIAAIVLGVLQ